MKGETLYNLFTQPTNTEKKIQMKEYEINNAIIERADITIGDRGFLDAWLSLNFGNAVQVFGGLTLYLPKSYSHHNILSVAGHHIFRIIEIAGVENWSQLPGRSIRVEGSWSEINRIGHIVKDDWYSPKDDFAQVRDILASTN
jgi:hypothetical protein